MFPREAGNSLVHWLWLEWHYKRSGFYRPCSSNEMAYKRRRCSCGCRGGDIRVVHVMHTHQPLVPMHTLQNPLHLTATSARNYNTSAVRRETVWRQSSHPGLWNWTHPQLCCIQANDAVSSHFILVTILLTCALASCFYTFLLFHSHFKAARIGRICAMFISNLQ